MFRIIRGADFTDLDDYGDVDWSLGTIDGSFSGARFNLVALSSIAGLCLISKSRL